MVFLDQADAAVVRGLTDGDCDINATSEGRKLALRHGTGGQRSNSLRYGRGATDLLRGSSKAPRAVTPLLRMLSR